MHIFVRIIFYYAIGFFAILIVIIEEGTSQNITPLPFIR